MLSYARCEEDTNQDQPHFLEACSLCNKPLGHNSDIFMYRGNTPFCSQECRQEQIERDESKEERWKLSSSSSKRATIIRQNKESTKKSEPNKSVRTGTVVEA